MRWLFLVAYTCSGLAGLVYEVTWTRLLTLQLGHTTAAASTVVGAFLLGLALGAGAGGRWAQSLTRGQALRAYAALELAAALAAFALPWQIAALTPVFRWAYQDGVGGALFPFVRVLSCLPMVMLPAAALGATFPLAIRWFAGDADGHARHSAMLYATNTAGAAVGAVLAGFVLIPNVGVTMSTGIGMAASAVSALAARFIAATADAGRAGPDARVAGRHRARVADRDQVPIRRRAAAPRGEPTAAGPDATDAAEPAPDRLWLAAAVLGLSGFAALLHEIAWTRILALVLGPTTYAFAATLAAVITGVAAGSWLGTWIVGRATRPATWLAVTLAAAAITASYTYALAGREVPLLVAQQLATMPPGADDWIRRGAWLTAALILPTTLGLGAAFPLALAMAGATAADVTGRVSMIYAVNTVGSVSGSLAAGFVMIPRFGLQTTLQVVSGCLVAAALAVVARGGLSRAGQLAGAAASAVALVALVASPPWDRELLASGAYLYAPFVPKDLDVEALLKAGTLRYYQEGAAATVSVKTLTGTTTLTVDGKTDASNRGDMLTQKLVAHLPLLLHDDPREVAVVGLGSGVTVGAALTHPVSRVDVLELSPEVVEASAFFLAENRHALADPRTRLIVGDGRSHLHLSRRRYDVIISEPSNPWIAGVAALFTQEFFTEARARLAPGGVFCQWANAYNIGDGDLRSIAATFTGVFPDATAWLIGEHDVLFIGTVPPLGEARNGGVSARLDAVARHWTRPGVAEDLQRVGAFEAFSVLSLFVAGPAELARYASGAPVLTDDRMTLEFSAPREIHRRSGGENGAALRALRAPGTGPPALVRAEADATAGGAAWRRRAVMLARSDVHSLAYDDFVRALRLDPDDAVALDGFVRSAVLLTRSADALSWVKTLGGDRTPSVARTVAGSKLLAASGARDDALALARAAAAATPPPPEALEQVAALLADAGDSTALDAAVAALRQAYPDRAATAFYEAVSAILKNDAGTALIHANRAIALDASYAPVYDLAGAAHTKLGQPELARAMFERSLVFDAHDSTAYTNLGLLALADGRRPDARRLFAEALWLDPASATAREGLARTR